jgi:D-aspartate ligase
LKSDIAVIMARSGAEPPSAPILPVQATHAIVLCKVLTGLATVRALARQGVHVHAVVFDPADPLRLSRYPQSVSLIEPTPTAGRLLQHIREVVRGMPGKPVLIATCDHLALFLARHRHQLEGVCRVWQTSFSVVSSIIQKERLYQLAESAQVPVIPWTRCEDEATLNAWVAQYPPPYIVKPSYGGRKGVAIHGKNEVFDQRADLLAFMRQRNRDGLLVQQILQGGDGDIYDTYGYADAQGAVRTICTHRRLRQHPPHFGSTTYGEIPSTRCPTDDIIISHTLALLAKTHYHGIFGIEWLRDRSTGRFYLIDFNARPFSSIGHLEDCGLNLPWLAMRELCGDPLEDVPLMPTLTHKLWVDLARDVQSRAHQAAHERVSRRSWALSLLKAQGHAYLDWRDPRPALRKTIDILPALIRNLLTS